MSGAKCCPGRGSAYPFRTAAHRAPPSGSDDSWRLLAARSPGDDTLEEEHWHSGLRRLSRRFQFSSNVSRTSLSTVDSAEPKDGHISLTRPAVLVISARASLRTANWRSVGRRRLATSIWPQTQRHGTAQDGTTDRLPANRAAQDSTERHERQPTQEPLEPKALCGFESHLRHQYESISEARIIFRLSKSWFLRFNPDVWAVFPGLPLAFQRSLGPLAPWTSLTL